MQNQESKYNVFITNNNNKTLSIYECKIPNKYKLLNNV
jgi:hypothetical protein